MSGADTPPGNPSTRPRTRPSDVADSTGLTSPMVRVALVAVWALGTVFLLSARPFLATGHLGGTRLAFSAALLGMTSVLVTHPRPDLGPVRPWVISLASPLVSFLWLWGFTSVPNAQLWGWQHPGNILGLLAARGGILPATIGTAAQTLVLLAWCLRLGQVPGAPETALFIQGMFPLVVGVIWNKVLLRSIRVTADSDAAAEEERRRARAADEAAARGRALMGRAEHLARPVLERLARRESGEQVALDAHIAESTIRDLIRAPRLSVAPLDAACSRARRSGVHVTLLDDGDESPLGGTLIGELATLVADADAAGCRSLTIRALPPERSDVVTFLAEGPAEGSSIRRTWPSTH